MPAVDPICYLLLQTSHVRLTDVRSSGTINFHAQSEKEEFSKGVPLESRKFVRTSATESAWGNVDAQVTLSLSSPAWRYAS